MKKRRESNQDSSQDKEEETEAMTEDQIDGIANVARDLRGGCVGIHWIAI
jgi:hypothetical protein